MDKIMLEIQVNGKEVKDENALDIIRIAVNLLYINKKSLIEGSLLTKEDKNKYSLTIKLSD